MRPWSFWTSRANSDPLPIKPRQDSQSKSAPAEKSEASWFTGHKFFTTGTPEGWDQQPEPQIVNQPYIIQPEDSIYPAFGRKLVLNRMDSPVQEPDDSVSSILRGVHEDEAIELVDLIKELREQAARDAELIAELRGQAEDNAHAIGAARIESERLMKELSAAASEARAAAATAAAAAASVTETAANSPPTHKLPTPPTTHSPPPRSPSPRSPPLRSPPPHLSPTHLSPTHLPPTHLPPTHLPPTHLPLTHLPLTHTPTSPPTTGERKEHIEQLPPVSTPSSPKTTYTNSPSFMAFPQPTPHPPPKTGERKEYIEQLPPVSTPSSPKMTYTNSPSFMAFPQPTPPSPPKTGERKKPLKQQPPVSTPSSPKVPQPTPSSANRTMFETYDRMINLLQTKPRQDIQLGDYPWPMFPEPAGSFPQRITLRSDVNKEKVYAFVQAYASAYGPGQRTQRGDAMVRAWKSIMDRSKDIILNGTVARAFTYMDMAARSQ